MKSHLVKCHQKIERFNASLCSSEDASCSSPPKVTFTISSGTPPPDCDEDDQGTFLEPGLIKTQFLIGSGITLQAGNII